MAHRGPSGEYDTLVVGSGMAGLSVAALLAHAGERVVVLEAHDLPGGYAHTFTAGAYRFCAQVHYIFNAGEGEPVHAFLQRVGLADEVRFVRLDPEGFDHVVVDGARYRVPNGLAKYRQRLLARHPEHAGPLRKYFETVAAIRDELDRLPEHPAWRDYATAPIRARHLLRWRTHTLQDFYDHVKMPPLLRAVLAGQCGDYLEPPARASFLMHASLVAAYDRGAYYPERHFSHLVDSVVGVINARPGCGVVLGRRVTGMDVERGRITAVHTESGETWRARRVVSNADPAVTAALVGERHFPRSWLRQLGYAQSCSSLTLYLGMKGLDPRDHGFGSFNTWHYPHADIDRIYAAQLERDDFSDPWLFLSTPTLHSDAPGLAPPGHHLVHVATSASFARFDGLRQRDRRAYNALKKRIRDRMIDIIEERYLPGLRRHLTARIMGTPATNARFVLAPRGNAYGAALTPEHVGLSRLEGPTPVENLFLCNATAGWPSVAGTIHTGTRLFEHLARA